MWRQLSDYHGEMLIVLQEKFGLTSNSFQESLPLHGPASALDSEIRLPQGPSLHTSCLEARDNLAGSSYVFSWNSTRSEWCRGLSSLCLSERLIQDNLDKTMKWLGGGENRNPLLIAAGYIGAFEDMEDSTSASSLQRWVTGCGANFPVGEETGALRRLAVWGSCSQLLPLLLWGTVFLYSIVGMDRMTNGLWRGCSLHILLQPLLSHKNQQWNLDMTRNQLLSNSMKMSGQKHAQTWNTRSLEHSGKDGKFSHHLTVLEMTLLPLSCWRMYRSSLHFSLLVYKRSTEGLWCRLKDNVLRELSTVSSLL